MKWEYEEIKAEFHRINEMGQECWELVTMYEYGGQMYAMFKRPIKEIER